MLRAVLGPVRFQARATSPDNLLRFSYDVDASSERLVDVAPAPILTGLERLNDRVSGDMEMVSSVSVRRRIATTNMSACQTYSKMYPNTPDSEAILAPLRARRDRSDGTQMGISTGIPHSN